MMNLKEVKNAILKNAKESKILKNTFLKKINLINSIKICFIIFVLCFCTMRSIDKIEIENLIKEMYFLDFIETKEKYLILEVNTNMFLKLKKDSKLDVAVLHLKDGNTVNVLVDSKNKLFKIDSGLNSNIENRVYKFNKTLEKTLLKENEEKYKDKNIYDNNIYVLDRRN